MNKSISGELALEKKANLAIKKYGMTARCAVVGFSGGADSTALLGFMTDLLGRENVVAVHVNHGLRGDDADADEAFCRELCEKKGVAFHAVHIDVRAECGDSAVEETARKMRYAALIDKARECGADAIALAHTASDNAETVMFNVARGCGISGLGIPPVRDESGIKIIRPLILVTRDEVIEYLGKKELSFVTDKTNFDTKYTRNFIRTNVIPEIAKVNAQAVKNISALSQRARVDEDFIDNFACEYVSRADADKLKNLRALHPAVLCRVIMKTAAVGGAGTLSFVHIEAVENLIMSGKSGDAIEIPGGVKALVADGSLRFVAGGAARKVEDFAFKLSGGVKSDALGFEVTFDAPEKDINSRVYRAMLPNDVLEKVSVRCRRAGDSYRYGNMTHAVKKLTTSVPFDARRRRPVFTFGDEIVWYPGFPVSDTVRGGDVAVYYIEKIL
ncbi:MAG: tRNA lysidine(34) synthetase TilS [Clostridia bacterium]|nr:tRNA lysidine(34) synthetase TilS [Clostridia bacterium]